VTESGGRPLNVCVVAHMAYGALSRTGGHIGGVEHQTALLSRWLAARGHRVSMITWDEGFPDHTEIDGVKLVKVCRRDDGWPGLRFVHPRWTSLVAAMRDAAADIYYHNCAEYVTGQVALWCRSNRRKFVYSVASNSDCDPRLPLLRTQRERTLYRAGLRRADRIIVQTETQRQMLHDSFGLGAVTIPMPCAAAPADTRERPGPQGSIVWIGRISEEKRPERLLDLAMRCPDLAFDFVGPSDGSAYAAGIVDRARTIANVTVHGGLGREQVHEVLRGAACLCCTSEIEGFPNTFLEAWSHGLPVLSTFDPDGLIAGRELGELAATPGDLAPRLRTLLSETRWIALSTNARGYFEQTHTIDAVMPRFEALFRAVHEAAV
jgi:glycosyltransferase involved in cell wall biosynthesis